MNTTTPSPEALKAAESARALLSLFGCDRPRTDVAAIIQQAIDTAVAERTKVLRDACLDAANELNRLRYKLDNDPDCVAAVETKVRNALKP